MRDLSYSQLMSRQTKLMEKMMARLGVNPAVAAAVDGSLAWHEARTKCLFCFNVLQCGTWIEGMAPKDQLESQLGITRGVQPNRGPTEFCPNIHFFQGCLLARK